MVSLATVCTKTATFVLLVFAITTFPPLAAAALVGMVTARDNIEMNFESNYTVANGIDRIFAQKQPSESCGQQQLSLLRFLVVQSIARATARESEIFCNLNSKLFIELSYRVRYDYNIMKAPTLLSRQSLTFASFPTTAVQSRKKSTDCLTTSYI
jgi:hypothetical protein